MEPNADTPSKRSVLIVDDNLQLAQTLRDLLSSHGFEVVVVSNGVLGLKHVLHKSVDAIICDLQMPQLEGDMFFNTVQRVNPEMAKKFIFITGMADDPHFQKFIATVNAPVLRKPVAVETLLEAIDSLPK